MSTDFGRVSASANRYSIGAVGRMKGEGAQLAHSSSFQYPLDPYPFILPLTLCHTRPSLNNPPTPSVLERDIERSAFIRPPPCFPHRASCSLYRHRLHSSLVFLFDSILDVIWTCHAKMWEVL
jgi:hypothetical protein